ncbi:DUF7882 family protein [Agromyces atrinae]|uniref:DUF7882 domain-containing protein n=1 Tax=Agromyces atrinae TaxID=592376 RepID=A0A4V1R221_9MICO|nr:hypothetical protein [Agromyces atrinae]NYD68308.1 hypothetical protein [Agromyces atrinae]RXZ85636.1 hypothetical protein ESP50_14180 [Agromyces atrinae]
MGHLVYGPDAHSYTIDDRTIAHLKAAVFSKLRRGETFTLTLGSSVTGRGRETIWITQSIPLRFVSDEDAPVMLNRQWVEDLVAAANTNSGMRIVAEPVLALAS